MFTELEQFKANAVATIAVKDYNRAHAALFTGVIELNRAMANVVALRATDARFAEAAADALEAVRNMHDEDAAERALTESLDSRG